MSERFRWWSETENRHNSRWNFHADGKWEHGHYVVADKKHGIFGHTSHIMGDAARIASLYWDRYLDTLDPAWLRDRAYPMIKGAAEFYRNFPNFRKGDDGKYHIYHVNNGESNWDTPDTPSEVANMHMIFPLAIRASEILGMDADLRSQWQEIVRDLVPVPKSNRGMGPGGFGGFIFGSGTEGAIAPLGEDRELKARFLNFNRTSGFIDNPGIGGAQIFRNRLRLREGPGAIDAEHIGGLTSGIHSSLLTNTAATGEDPVLQVFPGVAEGLEHGIPAAGSGSVPGHLFHAGGARGVRGAAIASRSAGQAAEPVGQRGGDAVPQRQEGPGPGRRAARFSHR